MKKRELGPENLLFFEALASPVRLSILQILAEKSCNFQELAKQLHLSHVMVANHIRKLEEASLVRIEEKPALRGRQKLCHLTWTDCWLMLKKPRAFSERIVQIPVGQYVNHHVLPPCGLAAGASLLGQLDDPRWFAEPVHNSASILWFRSGFVEYQVPNFMLSTQKLQEVSISLEICSEAPGFAEDYPSELFFSINGQPVGSWISPGDFGQARGFLNPQWWPSGYTQHGLRKELRLTDGGFFIDGERIDGSKLTDLNLEPGKAFSFRIEAPAACKYPGGMTLFGKDYGNYPQDLEVRFRFLE
jgi:predicted transcriptional regulator